MRETNEKSRIPGADVNQGSGFLLYGKLRFCKAKNASKGTLMILLLLY